MDSEPLSMITTLVSIDKGHLEKRILDRVQNDVITALNNITANSRTKFIINPTVWFNLKPTKSGKADAKPRVMNQAEYITRKLGLNLGDLGWRAGAEEQTIDNQKIDGYIEFPSSEPTYSLSPEHCLEVLNEFFAQHPDRKPEIRRYFNLIYNKYCARSSPLIEELPPSAKNKMKRSEPRPIRVGLEFETGNIASSFRAFIKLNNLFEKNLIDYGVFITSIDKANCAAKIWPVSNRNGSFEELNQRNYRESLSIPLLEIGFQPDSFNSDAKYLSADGSLYEPKRTKTRMRVNGIQFIQYKHRSALMWRPA